MNTCKKEDLLPRGFRLKWTCHFDEASSEIDNILTTASLELVSACADLAKKKVARLEEEYGTVRNVVKDRLDEEKMKVVDRIVEGDMKKSREILSKVKKQKASKTAPYGPGPGRPAQTAVEIK